MTEWIKSIDWESLDFLPPNNTVFGGLIGLIRSDDYNHCLEACFYNEDHDPSKVSCSLSYID